MIANPLQLSEYAQTALVAYALQLLPTEDNVSRYTAQSVGMSPIQAAGFDANWAVIQQSLPSNNGFSAVLLQNRSTGEKVLAVAGTSSWIDVLTDIGNIILSGTALGMPQYQSLEKFYSQLVSDGLVGASEQIVLTGHSLGGFLVQAFTARHPAAVSSAFTFNAPGFGSIEQELEYVGLTSATAANGKILNVRAREGLSFTSGFGTMLGTTQSVSIESSGDPRSNHSIVTLADALAVYAAYAKAQPGLTLENASRLFSMSGTSDRRLENALDALRTIFVGSSSNDANRTPTGDRDALYKNLTTLTSASGTLLNLSGQVQLTPANVGFARLAQENSAAALAYRYALVELLPFAAVGKTDATIQTLYGYYGNRLSLFESGTGSGSLTEPYLNDRETMLVGISALNSRNSGYDTLLAGKVAANYVYLDLASGMSLVFKGTAPNATVQAPQQVVFGDGRDNSLSGTDAFARGLGDRLYGGSGNDALSGLAGTDYLQGDLGDDTLDGGRDDDTLLGGAGLDTYVFSTAWGKDTLADADGTGSLLINGAAPGFAHANGGPGTWAEQRADGSVYLYRVQDSASSVTGKQLVITKQGDDFDSVTINNFNLQQALSPQGYLGVKLDPSPKIVVIEAKAPLNFWNDAQASLDSLIGRGSVVDAGKTFTVYLNQAYNTVQQLVLKITGLSSSSPKVVLGDETVAADGATIAVAPGQTEVSFALFTSGGAPSGDTGDLTISLQGDGGQSINSNTWGLTVEARPDLINTLTGDFTKRIINGTYQLDATGNYIPDPDNPTSPGAPDLLTGSDQPDHLQGLGGNDALFGGAGDDSLDGGDGVDVLQGGLGADTIDGGDGDDFIYGSSTGSITKPQTVGSESYPTTDPIVAVGFGWNVTNNGKVGVNGLPVLQLSDSLLRDEQVGDSGNVIDAGAGDDGVYAGTGSDRVDAGSGNDLVYGMAGADLLFGGAGNDYLLGDGPSQGDGVLVTFTPADAHGKDFLDGGEGDDTLIGQGSDDVVYGGLGADRLWGDDSDLTNTPAWVNGNDYLDGEEDDDTLVGGGKDDTLYGGSGSDQMWGDGGPLMPGDANYLEASYQGDDYLDGEDGDDTLVAQGGDDTLFGGAGADLLEGDDNSATRLPGQSHGNDYLDGGDGNDSLLGGGGDDSLYGGADNDLLEGDDNALDAQYHGDDYLDGEDGDDTVIGGGADDTLYGGIGDDRLYGDGASNEQYGGDDYLDGEDGNDLLFGGDGDDTLIGSAGDDVLQGDAGNDSLDAGDGNDTLYAGDGEDLLVGGEGTNVFVVQDGVGDVEIDSSSTTDGIVFGAGVALDTITGEVDGDVMTLRLSATRTVTVSGSIGVFQFADGSALSAEGMTAFLQAHPPAPPPPTYGTTVTNVVDANGDPAGSWMMVTDPDGSTTTLYSGSDGTGTKVFDEWRTAVGGYGSDSFNSNGSSSGFAYHIDGSLTSYADDGQGNRTQDAFDTAGMKVGDAWSQSDGTHGNDTFNPDGSSSGVTYRADGSYTVYADDGHGHVSTWSYGANGQLIHSGDGQNTYPSINDMQFTDGSDRVDVFDAAGNLSSTYYSADGTKLGETFTFVDGSHGSESFSAQGDGTGVIYRPDGTYETFFDNGTGQVKATEFNAAGQVTGSSIKETNGLNTIITYFNAGGAKTSQRWIHPDGSSGTDTVAPYDYNGAQNFLAATAARNLPYGEWWSMPSAQWRSTHDTDFYMDWWMNGTGNVGGSYGQFDTSSTSGQIYFAGYDFDYNAPRAGNTQLYSLSTSWWTPSGASGDYRHHLGEYSVVDQWSGLNLWGYQTTSGEKFFNYQLLGASNWTGPVDIGPSASESTRVVTGKNGAHDVVQDDGQGNLLVTSYSSDGARHSDVWLHNDGSHGADSYFADGSSSGVSVDAEGTYSQFTRDAHGTVSVDILPGAKGVANTTAKVSYSSWPTQGPGSAYTAPPRSIAPAAAPGSTSTPPAGGTGNTQSHTYSNADLLFDLAHRGLADTCDQVETIYNPDGTVLSKITVHTDPGYELSVRTAAGTVGWRYDASGRAMARSVDTGNGSVVTYCYDATGALSQRQIAESASDGSLKTTSYSSLGQVLGFRVQRTLSPRETRIDSYDAGGRLTSRTETFSDGKGNVVSSSWSADGVLQSMATTVVSSDGNAFTTANYDGNRGATGIVVTHARGDGAVQTDSYDAQGQLVASVVASPGGKGEIDTFNYDATGSITSFVKSTVDAQHNTVLATYDAQARKVREDVLRADGVQASTDYALDGSSITRTIAIDGSFTVAARDAAGNVTTSSYCATGTKISDAWTRADGSHGTDTFAADGSWTGQGFYADGSTASFVTHTAGKTTATYKNASGSITGSAVTTSLDGKTDVIRYNAAGTKLTERWWGEDGSYGSTDWTNASVIRTEDHHADGSYAVTTDDRKGNLFTTQYSLTGVKAGDSWSKPDGSHGWDIYKGDGSSTSTTIASDGTSSRLVKDGLGNATAVCFDAAGNRLRDSWTRADGSHGSDTFASDGTVSGTRVSADGTTVSFTNAPAVPSVSAPIADQAIPEGLPWAWQLPAGAFFEIDAGDMLTYTAHCANGSALPAWLSFDAKTRTFSGTPPFASIGTFDVMVSATDMAGLGASDMFTLTVKNPNSAPVLSQPIAAQSTWEDQPWTFQLASGTFTDRDAGDALTYRATLADDKVLPPWITFDAATCTFSGTPSNSEVGDLTIKITASDSQGLQAIGTFSLTVVNVNDAPVIARPLADQSVNEDSAWNFAVATTTFSDVDAGDTLRYTAALSDGSALPAWLSFDPASLTFSGTPTNDDVGQLGLAVSATDAAGASVAASFVFTVVNVNDPPVVSEPIDDQVTDEDSGWSLTLPTTTFCDVDAGDTLTWSATRRDGSALPAWMSFDPAARRFSGTPVNGDVGTVDVMVTAVDSSGASASTGFTLTVVNVNDAPTVLRPIDRQSVDEDSSWAFSVPATTFDDVDLGDSLTYTAARGDGTALPSWLTFDGSTLTFSGTPTNDDVGDLAITVTATDLAGAGVSDSFELTVINVNDAPVVVQDLPDQQTVQGTPWTFTVPSATFGDPDLGDTLTYSARLAGATGLPLWLTFDPQSRTFSGTPTGSDTGVFDVEVVATDTSGAAASQVFALTVANPEGATPFVGTVGADSLVGSFGADRIDGLLGDDTLRGLAGDDTLTGGGGSDQYFFGRGDGRDTILDVDNTRGNQDVLAFGNGIAADQLWLRRVNADLEISVIGTTDTVTISGWYTNSNHRIEILQLSDGQRLLDGQVQTLVQAMAAFAPPPLGQTTLGPTYQNQLEPVMAANWQ